MSCIKLQLMNIVAKSDDSLSMTIMYCHCKNIFFFLSEGTKRDVFSQIMCLDGLGLTHIHI